MLVQPQAEIGSEESASALMGGVVVGKRKARKKPLSGKRWGRSERRSSLSEVLLANSFALFWSENVSNDKFFQNSTFFQFPRNFANNGK